MIFVFHFIPAAKAAGLIETDPADGVLTENRLSMNKTPTNVELETEKYSVALDEFPEFAAQVGVLISCYALIESYMHQLISRTTGMDESDAYLVSGSFISFGARIELLDTLLKKRDQQSKEVVAAKHFIKILREATTIRNTYAHGTYSLGFEGGHYSPTAKKIMYISSFLYDAKRKTPSKLEQDLDGIKKDVARMKFITCEIHGYIYRGEMPVL